MCFAEVVAMEETEMIIAVGMDVHKERSSAYAIYAGTGTENEKHRKFLNSFNNEFSDFPSTVKQMEKIVAFMRGHQCHVLLENSTKTHDVYWILKNLGIDVTVAQSGDLYRITKSVTKTDRNDSIELAGYMRRRLNGEDEFAECFIPSPEWMTKRELCRGLSAEKEYLTKTKRRIRAHLLLHGIHLKKEYSDITCPNALAELSRIKDAYLMMQVKFATDAINRIAMGEKTILYMFSKEPLFILISSITGFGTISAAYFTSLIVDIKRFPTSDHFTASFGVVPKMRASGGKNPNCATTHKGDDLARYLLMFCVLAHVKHEEDSVVTKMYRRLVNNGKAKREAMVAAGRKLLTVVYSVLKSGRPFTANPEVLTMARQDMEEAVDI
jgi:transposase